MLEAQPDEVVAATLWELEQAVGAALPSFALIRASRSDCGGYNVLAQWPSTGPHGNRARCTLTCHFSVTTVRAYYRMNHPKRAEACGRVSRWLSLQLGVQAEAEANSADTGIDMHCAAPAAFFSDDNEPIRVSTQDKAHDFAPYRGAPPPLLTE